MSKYSKVRTARVGQYNPNKQHFGKSLTRRENLVALDFIEKNMIWTAKLPGDLRPRQIETRTLDGTLVVEGFGLEVAASALHLDKEARHYHFEF
jgi:hypothetical protein